MYYYFFLETKFLLNYAEGQSVFFVSQGVQDSEDEVGLSPNLNVWIQPMQC